MEMRRLETRKRNPERTRYYHVHESRATADRPCAKKPTANRRSRSHARAVGLARAHADRALPPRRRPVLQRAPLRRDAPASWSWLLPLRLRHNAFDTSTLPWRLRRNAASTVRLRPRAVTLGTALRPPRPPPSARLFAAAAPLLRCAAPLLRCAAPLLRCAAPLLRCAAAPLPLRLRWRCHAAASSERARARSAAATASRLRGRGGGSDGRRWTRAVWTRAVTEHVRGRSTLRAAAHAAHTERKSARGCGHAGATHAGGQLASGHGAAPFICHRWPPHSI